MTGADAVVQVPSDETTAQAHDDVLAELRLDPAWSAVRASAARQALATALAERLGVRLGADTLSAASSQIWADRAVDTLEDLAAWMRERGVDEGRVRGLVHGEAYRRWGEEQVSAGISKHVLDRLQLSAEYPRLRARAADKRAQLARRGLLGAAQPVDAGYQELLTWWTRHRPHLAPSKLADDAGDNPFATEWEFRRAMIDEYHYVTRCHRGGGADPAPGHLEDADIVSRPCPWT